MIASSSQVSEKTRSWGILSGIFILIMLINVDYTAVNLALVTISQDLNADLNTLQWLLSGYILAWAALVVPGGQVADIFGKRRILLMGVVVFMVASALCGFVTSAELLILGRVLQGMGGALFVPPLYTLLFESFPENKRGFAMGMLGLATGIGLAIGPSFGGFILSTVGWRWIFLINIPLCLLSMLPILKCVEKEPPRLSNKKVDLVGSFLFSSALGLMVFALNQTEVWGYKDPRLWGLFFLGLGFLITFIKTLKGKENRLIPEGLFQNRSFLGCIAGWSLTCYTFSTILLIMGLYLQTVQGYSPYDAGIIFFAMTIALGGLSPIAGSLCDRMDPRIPICGGILLLGMSTFLAANLTTESTLPIILITLLGVGLGIGLVFPALNATMLKIVDPKIINTASGTFTMAACLGNTLGIVISSSLLVGIGLPLLNKSLSTNAIALSDTMYESLLTILSSAHRDLSLLSGLEISEVQTLVFFLNNAFVSAMFWIMLITTVFSVLTFILGYRMIRVKATAS